MPDCSVQSTTWSQLTTEELYAVLRLRTNVFFVEQKVDEEELDGRDQEPTTEHLWIADEKGVAAYLRVLVDAEAEHLDAHRLFGRVAVRADRRGEGLAQILIERVIADHGHEAMLLHAQAYIQSLYLKYGFVPFGELFVEAGIEHMSMYRPGSPA